MKRKKRMNCNYTKNITNYSSRQLQQHLMIPMSAAPVNIFIIILRGLRVAISSLGKRKSSINKPMRYEIKVKATPI